jgi:transcriptional regulator of acetoin/glycerol metabolism
LEADNGVILAANLALPAEPEMQPNLQPTCPPGDLTLDTVVRHHVQYVLDLNRGNKLRAARQLAISRSTLYRILGNESLL